MFKSIIENNSHAATPNLPYLLKIHTKYNLKPKPELFTSSLFTVRVFPFLSIRFIIYSSHY